jgi:hypothetical protein
MVEGNFDRLPKGKIHLNYILEYPHYCRKQILGITNYQFQDLLAQAEMQHKKLQGEIESKKIPINQKGGGGKPKLEIKEEVCLSLFSLRKMLTFEVLGLHFGISKTEAKDTFNYWLEILGNVLPASPLKQVEKHDSDYGIPTENKRHETKSFPARVFLLNTSLDL